MAMDIPTLIKVSFHKQTSYLMQLTKKANLPFCEARKFDNFKIPQFGICVHLMTPSNSMKSKKLIDLYYFYQSIHNFQNYYYVMKKWLEN